MVHVRFPAENQGNVVELAAHAAKVPAAATKLTSALFEAEGVSVTDTAPSASAERLVQHQPISATELRLGTEAMERLTENSFVGRLEGGDGRGRIGRTAAMLEANTNKPSGRAAVRVLQKS